MSLEALRFYACLIEFGTLAHRPILKVRLGRVALVPEKQSRCELLNRRLLLLIAVPAASRSGSLPRVSNTSSYRQVMTCSH